MNQARHPNIEAGREERAGAPPSGGPVILQVLPRLETGGVERGTVDIAEAIGRAGGTALVASAGGPMVHELDRAGAEHVALPLDRKGPLAIRANAGRLARIVRERGVHVVHARSRAPAWSAFLAARRTGCRFVTTFHATYGAGTALKRWYNSIMGRGERVIAISEFIAAHAMRIYGIPRERIRVIHRGVDVSRFDPERVGPERLVRLADAWRLPDGVNIITLPGRLTRWKGQAVAIEAVARLGRPDVVCLLVGADQGRTGYRKELEALILKHGLGGRVHVVDHCDDMAAAYMMSDVVVSASLDPEGFGRVIAEAQAMGRVVVATDHGAAREIVVPGTGWLAPPGDAAALAVALERALALDAGARAEIAARAIANVRARFTKPQMCEKTLAVYDELLFGERPLGAP
ncbi:MAG: glycosyltransferase family 4 protein [Proteobacteria bacterium]|nr:glycosyltransferase family 4 protein [Pseudomonadota bacterium]